MGELTTTLIDAERYGDVFISFKRAEHSVPPSFLYFGTPPEPKFQVLEIERKSTLSGDVQPIRILVGNIDRFCSDLDGDSQNLFDVKCFLCQSEDLIPLRTHNGSFGNYLHRDCHQELVSAVEEFVDSHREEIFTLQV